MHPVAFTAVLALLTAGQVCSTGRCHPQALQAFAVQPHYYQVNPSPPSYGLTSPDINQLIRTRQELDRLEEALTTSTYQKLQRLQQQPSIHLRQPLLDPCPPGVTPNAGAPREDSAQSTAPAKTDNPSLPVLGGEGVAAIFQKYKCNECHVAKGHTQFLSGVSLNALSLSKKREVMGWVVTGDMPPGKDAPDLTDEELAIIARWAKEEANTPAFNPVRHHGDGGAGPGNP